MNENTLQIKQRFFRVGWMLLANLTSALAVVIFLSPNGLSGGGFAGIAIVINYIVPVPIGLFVFVLSIPLFIWAYFAKGGRYVLGTLVGTAISSALTDGLAFLPSGTEDRLLAAIFGGVLYAISEVCLIKADVASGGTDLLDRLIITVKKNVSLGTMFVMVDGTIVLSSAIVSGKLETGLYGFLCLGVCSMVTDLLVQGLNRAVYFHVVTSRPGEEMAAAIMSELRRGVTRVEATGMYTREHRAILLVVVDNREACKLRHIIRRVDPSAFTIIMEAAEIVGCGFDSAHDSLHGTQMEKKTLGDAKRE